jgi:hypothetical protein
MSKSDNRLLNASDELVRIGLIKLILPTAFDEEIASAQQR